jgi:hypothetical protein
VEENILSKNNRNFDAHSEVSVAQKPHELGPTSTNTADGTFWTIKFGFPFFNRFQHQTPAIPFFAGS